jgi:hypothetical protein
MGAITRESKVLPCGFPGWDCPVGLPCPVALWSHCHGLAVVTPGFKEQSQVHLIHASRRQHI